jgi:hypothetical protein
MKKYIYIKKLEMYYRVISFSERAVNSTDEWVEEWVEITRIARNSIEVCVKMVSFCGRGSLFSHFFASNNIDPY